MSEFNNKFKKRSAIIATLRISQLSAHAKYSLYDLLRTYLSSRN